MKKAFRAANRECGDYSLGVRGKVVECKTEHATGEASGTDEVTDVNVTFKGCVAATGYPATSPGHTPGEIVTFQLKGRLGYINKANHEVGVLLQPATAGGLFAEFEIGEEPGEILEKVGVGNSTEVRHEELGTTGNDGVISPITPVNHMSHTFTQNYRIEEAEIPCPRQLRRTSVQRLQKYAQPLRRRAAQGPRIRRKPAAISSRFRGPPRPRKSRT